MSSPTAQPADDAASKPSKPDRSNYDYVLFDPHRTHVSGFHLNRCKESAASEPQCDFVLHSGFHPNRGKESKRDAQPNHTAKSQKRFPLKRAVLAALATGVGIWC